MSKHLGLAIVAAGLLLTIGSVADAGMGVRTHSTQNVVQNHVHTGSHVVRHHHHRVIHRRRVVSSTINNTSLNQAVAHRCHRRGYGRRWNC